MNAIVNATTTAAGVVGNTIGTIGGLFETTPILSLVLGISLFGVAVGVLIRLATSIKA